MVDRGGRASLGQNNVIPDSTVTESEGTSKRNIVAKFALKEGFHEINYFLPLSVRRVPTGKPNAGSGFRDYAGRKLYYVRRRSVGGDKGYFRQLGRHSNIYLTSPDLSTGVLDIEIQAASVDTGSSMKNGKLKGKDFFDFQKNPLITFRSTKIVQTGPDSLEVGRHLYDTRS